MKTRFYPILLAALTALSIPTLSAQVNGFTVVKPTGVPGALLTLPGSVRRISLNCASGCSTTNTATWSVSSTSGGASATIVPSSTGNYADVTLGATGGTCPVTGASGSYTVTATAKVVVTATATNDPSKSDSVILDVCSPAVEAYTIPFYRVLYSGQSEDVQGVIWGSSNRDGTWQIISQPSGGDATISDSRYQDTVFHATVKGLYKIQWTSAADGSKTAYSTFYVTGNAEPRLSQPNGTEPIDCTVDPNTTGGVLDVGPTQPYKNLEAIAPAAMVPGVTIRLHNEDTTGSNPTTYHEWVQISTAGTHDNPIRLCGVADSKGNLPVMDGINATARGDVLSPTSISGFAAIMVYAKNYDPYPGYSGGQYILVEGIAMRNYGLPNKYYPAGTTTGAVPYNIGSSGFRFQICRDCELNGAEVYANGNGVFAEANDARAWGGVSQRLLFEGNNVHDNGASGDNHEHNWYVQAWFQVEQFNQTPTYNLAASGSQFKDRGMSWFRYNLVGTGAQRDMDLVEDQDAANYLNPNLYLTSFRVSEPKDQYTGDQLAAAQEAWHHSENVYGNIFKTATTGSIHFAADNQGGYTQRVGTLNFFDNTANFAGAPSWINNWFDTGDNSDNYPHYEWPTVNVSNLVVSGANSATHPYFSWNSQRDAFMNFNGVQISPNWGTNVQTCAESPSARTGACDNTGWPYFSNTDAYFNGNSLSANLAGVGTFTQAGSTNFLNATTYQASTPVTGNPLTGDAAELPVRFQYVPSGGYAIPRAVVVNDTTGGTMGAVDSGTAPTVPPPPATATPVSIALNPAALSLAASAQAGVTCITTLSDGSSRACLGPVLSSSNTASATVSGLVVTATSVAGSGTISASAEGLKGSASFTVSASTTPPTKPTPTPTTVSITIAPASLALTEGQRSSVVCSAALSDRTTRACNNPILMSSNMASATVAGLVVSATNTAGSGTITALAEGLSARSSFSVSAEPAKTSTTATTAVSLQLTPTVNYLNRGRATTVYCTTKLSNGQKRACIAPVLSISNVRLALLSGTRVTANAQTGVATLTVKAEGQTATAVLNVR